ncbi:MAG: pirin family protein [Saprospiraceae bacterium]
MKNIIKIAKSSPAQVGDGFFIRRPMPSGGIQLGEMSPFLLLDHAGPTHFPPSDQQKGVDVHPHRGFETVTINYQGEIEHRDSGGNAGKIAAGDVQWMTAASGVVHEEKHGSDFTKKGGTLEMIQLWVNLPGRFKMSKPKYQEIKSAEIPIVRLADNAGYIRVIAGELDGKKGAATTFTPLNLLDARLNNDAQVTIPVTNGHNAAIYVLEGKLQFASGDTAEEGEIAVFDPLAADISFSVKQQGKFLILTGEPLNEPIASYGPFVMNTAKEIEEALQDFQTGKMGVLS